MNKILNVVKIIMLFIVLFFIGFTHNFVLQKQNVKNKEVIITKGDKPNEIYKKLGLKYNVFDKIYFRLTLNDRKIKNGYYLFSKNISKFEIIEQLINSRSTQIVLTIPEGFTTDEVLDRIEQLGLATKKEMLESMKGYNFYYKHTDNFEGYLLPQTYFIAKGESPKEILDKILNTFLQEYPVNKYDKDEMFNILTLASIVEKEANNDEDRPKVSAVFKNRLKISMPLQSDATLRYELKRDVTKNDLKTNDSEYNTYKHRGLTPSPICNPGEKSIDAAINPEKDFNDLYFFMYKNKTYYSMTHEEHLNKRKESGHLK